jgi:hypothetical protein
MWQLKNNIQYIVASRVSWIGENAFNSHKNLKVVQCPNCTSVGIQAFLNVTNLVSVELGSNCTIDYSPFNYAGTSTFYSLTSLTTINGGLRGNYWSTDTTYNSYWSDVCGTIITSCPRLYGSVTILNKYLYSPPLYDCGGSCATSQILSIYLPNFIGGSSISYNYGGYNYSWVRRSPAWMYQGYVSNYGACIDIYMPKVQCLSGLAYNTRQVRIYMNEVSSIPTLTCTQSSDIFSYVGSIQIFVPSSLYTNFKRATNWTLVSSRIYSM